MWSIRPSMKTLLHETFGSGAPTLYYKGDLMDAEVHTASKIEPATSYSSAGSSFKLKL